MITKITDWLSNPKRKYTDGLNMFNALASDQQKSNFKEFFSEDAKKVSDQFDIKFTMLVNQMVFILNRIKNSPEAFIQAVEQPVENSKTDETLQPAKPLNLEELPPELQVLHNRIKEIVPLMAKFHADMAAEIADDKRMPLIEQLIALDDERRNAWAQIDAYQPSEDEIEVEMKNLAMGADIQKRIVQLKENISRNKENVKKHTENNKKNLAAKAQENLEKYTAELAQLESLVNK